MQVGVENFTHLIFTCLKVTTRESGCDFRAMSLQDILTALIYCAALSIAARLSDRRSMI